MRKYVKHGIMIVIGDIVNITVLILIVIVFVTGTFCTLDIAIRKFEATEKVGNFKVCKNLSQISHWPGWHQDHSGLHSSTESFFYSDARPICLLSPRIFRVSRTSSNDIFQDFCLSLLLIAFSFWYCTFSLLQIRAQHGLCGRNWPDRLWRGGRGVETF